MRAEMTGPLLLAYVFATFVVGAACVGAVLVLTRLRQDALARAFLLLYLPLSVLVLAALLLALVETQPAQSVATLSVLEYLESFVGRYSVMLALPLFAHRVFGVRSCRRDAVLLAIVVTALAAQHITEFLLGGAWDTRGDVAEDLLFGAVVVYTMLLAFRRLRMHGVYAPLARRFLLLLLIGLPGVAYDLFIVDGPGLRIYPLWYGALGMTMVLTLVGRRSTTSGAIPREWDLTDREAEVLRLVQQGLSNQQIARQLVISPNTVKTHLRAIFDKSGFRTRVALIAQM
ncbi:MAG TPA: helix-turn-helix transcriptional regulator [Thermoanaerobaculia bacterium]|nr:helix-turn-helix transcriptional regulator [Thermoanaerobaculia bacterium]